MQPADRRPSPEQHRAIADATIRYCWAIDERDWATLDSVFSEDAVVEFDSGQSVRGLAGIQAFIAGVLDPLDGSQHMVTNHQVFARDGQLESRCYFHAQHTRRGVAGGANFVVAGIYRDVWLDEPSGWRIARRRLEVLWTEGNAAVVGRVGSEDRSDVEDS